ncbi:MAG TPA: hypothetical protein VF710_25630, partial [Longimicrobium sp.]
MNRKVIRLFSTSAFFGALVGCNGDAAQNCERLGYFPADNHFEIDYTFKVPAKCPVPLASPGLETKYA